MTNQQTKFEDSRPNRSPVIDRKPFDWILQGQGQSDLDLWPRDLENNRGLLLVMTNQQTKFEDSRPNCSPVIDRKPLDWILPGQGQSDLDLWPRDLKNNRGLLLVMKNQRTKFEDSRLHSSLVIDRKPSIYRRTDRHVQSNIPPLISKGGYNNIKPQIKVCILCPCSSMVWDILTTSCSRSLVCRNLANFCLC